jgi:hypothetical protein
MEMAMPTRRHVWRALAALPLINAFLTPRARAESAQSPSSGPGQMMLTIFLRHDENKTLGEINQHLKETGWFKDFPPPDVEVVSWYVMMGIGQVVTLRFPAERLREINRLVESEAWGAFRTEFYPTYDYRALRAQLVRQMG